MTAAFSKLTLAIVGHTNTGKTSLLRTLTRDPSIGEVADMPGTTRHVQQVTLEAGTAGRIVLADTPGLEDGIGLLDYLDQLCPPQARLDGPSRLTQFLASPGAHTRFEQEARVIRQLLDSDAALYVIDARDPVLGKHRDELAILQGTGRPLLPVLNFMHDPGQRSQAWRTALARLGLHVTVEFDTVAPELDGEVQLYGKLATLLDTHSHLLQGWLDTLAAQRRRRHDTAASLIAELLLDTAALRLSCAPDEASVRHAGQQLQDTVRQREQHCVSELLALYRFSPADYAVHPLPLIEGRWDMDLFHPQALRHMGIRVGKGMAAGAMAGAAVDVFTAGLSLGAAAMLGAAAGGLWQGAETWGKRLAGRLRGSRELTVDDVILRLLALRQQSLAQALEKRGHAATAPIATTQAARTTWQQEPLPVALETARAHPEWSSLSPDYAADTERQASITALAQTLDLNPPEAS